MKMPGVSTKAVAEPGPNRASALSYLKLQRTSRRTGVRRGGKAAVSEPKTTFFGEAILPLKTQF